MIFGFSVVVFTMTFVGLVLILANSEQSQAVSSEPQKVVFVEKESPVEMISVLTPTRDIKQGEKLEPAMFTIMAKPRLAVAATALQNPEQLRGAYARALLVKDQPVSQEMVNGAKHVNPVVANIQPGYRAVTINVNATSSVEGWASAGAFVDVHWISDVTGQKTATLIVQNAKILSAERQVENQQNGGQPVPTTVTLLVGDKDAQRISLASTGGALALLLRGNEDANKASVTTTLTLKDLLGMDSARETKGMARVRNDDGSFEEISVVGKRISKQS